MPNSDHHDAMAVAYGGMAGGGKTVKVFQDWCLEMEGKLSAAMWNAFARAFHGIPRVDWHIGPAAKADAELATQSTSWMTDLCRILTITHTTWSAHND